MKEDYDRTIDKIVRLLENEGFRSDKDQFRHFLIMMVTATYKVKAVNQDLSNEALGELIISELNTSLQSHFARKNTTEIVRAIFIGIAKFGFTGGDDNKNDD